MKLKIYLQSTLSAMAGREREREEDGNKKIGISREQKELFTLNKKTCFRFFKDNKGHYL